MKNKIFWLHYQELVSQRQMDVANFCDQLDNDKKRNFVDDQFIALLRTIRVQDESKISLLVRSLSHFVLQVAIKC